MNNWYRTKSGREVLLQAVYIRAFDRGILEGRAELVRENVLRDLEADASSVFPGTNVFVSPLTSAIDEYPPLIYICEFHSVDPVDPVKEIADCSSLVVCWFASDMNEPIPDFVRKRMEGVEWEKHARDGYY